MLRESGAPRGFRYRGYIYDEESGFYYLNSRYYDPQVGRFVNADSYVSTGTGTLGYNMFAYCNNNPVMYVDPSGELALLATMAIGALVGAFINISVSMLVAQSNDQEYTWKNAVADGIGGAITGAVGVTGIGALGQAVAGFVAGGISSLVLDALNQESLNWTRAKNAASAGAIGAFVSGSGLGLTQANADVLDVLVETFFLLGRKAFVRSSVTSAILMYFYDQVNLPEGEE